MAVCPNSCRTAGFSLRRPKYAGVNELLGERCSPPQQVRPAMGPRLVSGKERISPNPQARRKIAKAADGCKKSGVLREAKTAFNVVSEIPDTQHGSGDRRLNQW